MAEDRGGRIPENIKEILNTGEACRYLGTSRFTLLRLIAEEGLPALKLGRQWRFVRTDLVAWLRSKRPAGLQETEPKAHETGGRADRRS